MKMVMIGVRVNDRMQLMGGDKRMADMKSKISIQEAEIRDKDETITKLQKELEEKDDKIAKMESEAHMKNKGIRKLIVKRKRYRRQAINTSLAFIEEADHVINEFQDMMNVDEDDEDHDSDSDGDADSINNEI